MLTKLIKLKSFKKQKLNKKLQIDLNQIITDENELIKSLGKNYIDKYKFSKIKNLIGKNDIRVIGMGGSILGSKAIYKFLKDRIKKKFFFIDNLNLKKKSSI